jgi:hypothetical protein
MYPFHRDQRGQSLVIVLSLITILFLLGSALAVHASAALRATRASEDQGDDFYAADAATELGIWWQRNGKAGNPPAQTINGVTTSTTITTAGGGGGSCPADPKPIWLSGFEHGVLSSSGGGLFSLTGPTGYTFVNTSAARTGSYGLDIYSLDAFNHGYAQPKAGMTGALKILRFAIKFPALPSPNIDVDLLILGSSTDSNALFLGYTASTQKLNIHLGPNTPVQASSTISPNTWYGVDIRLDISTNPRKVDWLIDGVAQTQVTLAVAAGTDIGALQLGASSGFASNFHIYFDDVVISSTSADYPYGDFKVAALRPNAMHTDTLGYWANFQNNDSTAISSTSWQRDDEIPISGTTDWIKQITSSGGGYVGFDFEDTAETCIRGAAIVATMKAQSGAPNAGLNSVMNSTTVTLWSGSLSTSVVYVGSVLSTICCPLNPGVGPWTQAGINGAWGQFGFCTNTTSTRRPEVHAVLMEYGYRPMGGGGPATVTIVGTAGGSTTTTTYPDAGAGVPTLSTWTVTK